MGSILAIVSRTAVPLHLFTRCLTLLASLEVR